jgi:serine/threonine-protein kinase
MIGRYMLFGEIASGGMATVHFGRLSGPAGFSRTIAIKRLHPQYAKDPDFVSMFLDEARLAARIQHPNVVQTLDVVAPDDGEIFLVMEYVQGESLARLLRSVRSMMTPADTHVIATIMTGVLHGLHAAHEAKSEHGEPLGIVHRDVSPQNVLVGIDGVPRVLDFGVAKAAGRLQTTREGQLKGKLSYMAPEQLHGAGVTRQTDVYAAAVVTWEALTGKRLFQEDNEAAMVTAILQRTVAPPSEIASHVPLAFDRVVMRGLERDPARRYTTAREMALDMERCVGVASASEVGEWVESLAHDELLKRASRVTEIESASSSPSSAKGRGAMPAVGEMPTTVTQSTPDAVEAHPELRSDVSSIAVSPILPLPTRHDRTRTAVVAGTAIAGTLAVVFLLLLVFRREPASPPPVLAATALPAASGLPADPSVAAAASATASTSPEPPSIAVSELPIAPPSATASSPSTPSASPASAGPAPAPRHRVFRAGPAAAPAPDCDPPFTIDALGHKHYKPACLN